MHWWSAQTLRWPGYFCHPVSEHESLGTSRSASAFAAKRRVPLLAVITLRSLYQRMISAFTAINVGSAVDGLCLSAVSLEKGLVAARYFSIAFTCFVASCFHLCT